MKIARQYRIETPIPADAFFEHLPQILESTYTLVIGCYEFRADLRAFLEAEEASEEELYFHPADTFDLNRGEYPHGVLFHVPAEQRILDRLNQTQSHIDYSF